MIKRVVVILLICAFIFTLNCSKNKSTSYYCDKFSQGVAGVINVLIDRKANQCLLDNVNNSRSLVRKASIYGLYKISKSKHIKVFIKRLNDVSFSVVLEAAKIISKLNNKNNGFLKNKLKTANAKIKRAIIYAFIENDYTNAGKEVSRLLYDASSKVRIAAALYFANSKLVDFKDELQKSLRNENDSQVYNVKKQCLIILRKPVS